jgi:hypothetical protein
MVSLKILLVAVCVTVESSAQPADVQPDNSNVPVPSRIQNRILASLQRLDFEKGELKQLADENQSSLSSFDEGPNNGMDPRKDPPRSDHRVCACEVESGVPTGNVVGECLTNTNDWQGGDGMAPYPTCKVHSHSGNFWCLYEVDVSDEEGHVMEKQMNQGSCCECPRGFLTPTDPEHGTENESTQPKEPEEDRLRQREADDKRHMREEQWSRIRKNAPPASLLPASPDHNQENQPFEEMIRDDNSVFDNSGDVDNFRHDNEQDSAGVMETFDKLFHNAPANQWADGGDKPIITLDLPDFEPAQREQLDKQQQDEEKPMIELRFGPSGKSKKSNALQHWKKAFKTIEATTSMKPAPETDVPVVSGSYLRGSNAEIAAVY